jgi:hypothetical protein
MNDSNLHRAISTILSQYKVKEIRSVKITESKTHNWIIEFDTDRITPNGKRISISMPVTINYVDVE